MFWDEFVGLTVSGKYRLRQLIGSTARSGVYLVTWDHGVGRGALKLSPLGEAPLNVPLLDHPNIIRLFDSGTCEAGKFYFHYFVTELADGDLGAVLSARALSPDETRKMLYPALEALTYLHDRGLAHARIRPSNLLVVGGTFKLSVDSIRREGSVASASKDMWALGLTVIEALTQERRPSLIASIPKPLQDLVQGSLQTHSARPWTARSAAAWLSSVVQPDPAPPPDPQPTPSCGVGVFACSRALERWHWRSSLRTWIPPQLPRERSSTVKEIAVYGTAALLLLAEGLFVVARGPGSSYRPVRAVESETIRSFAIDSSSVPPGNQQPVNQQEEQAHEVVVGSFSSLQNALQQAQSIAREWPEFTPQVSQPSALNGYYRVVIGSDLSEETARGLRQRAVASGLPPDTFIRAYPSSRQ